MIKRLINKIITFCFINTAVLILINAFAYAHTSQQISNGLTWLRTSQTSNGSWTTDVTTSFHSTAIVTDSLYSFGVTGATYTNAINWLNAQQVENTGYLSLKIISLFPASVDISSELNELISYKKSDNGFGEYLGDNSDISYTALALKALKSVNYSNQATISNAVLYLVTNRIQNRIFI